MENDDLKNMGRESDLPKELSEYLMKNHPLKAKEETEKRTERQHRGGEHTAKKESEKKTEEIKEEKQNAEEEISAETKHETKTSSIFEAIKNKAMNDENIPSYHEEEEEKYIPDDITKKIDFEEVKRANKAENERRETAQKKEDKKKTSDIEYVFDDEPVRVVRNREKSKWKHISIPKSVEKETKGTKQTKPINKTEEREERAFENPEVKHNFEEIGENILKSKKKPEVKEKKKHFMDKNNAKFFKKADRGTMLDKFFNENQNEAFEEDDRKINYSKAMVIGAAVAFVLIIFLGVRTISLSAKLKEANNRIATLESLQQENEDLKMNKLSLEEDIQKYENGEDPNADTASGDSGNADTYTVVAGDTFSTISMKVYGNYSGYKKIMDANGITNENDLQLGQTLKIPK